MLCIYIDNEASSNVVGSILPELLVLSRMLGKASATDSKKEKGKRTGKKTGKIHSFKMTYVLRLR